MSEIEYCVEISEKNNENNSKAEQVAPHCGRSIQTIVCSTNFEYVATFSQEGKDVFGYPVDKDKISARLYYDHSVNSNDNEILNDAFDLIAVSDCKHIIVETYKKNDKFPRDFIFSTENGMIIAEDNECSFNEYKYFVASEEGECLILQKGESFFITEPCRLDNKVNADKLFQLDNIDQNEKKLYPCIIHSDRAIGVCNGYLWIKKLIYNEWKKYLCEEFNEYYKVNNLLFGKEIERHLKETLESCESDPKSPPCEGNFFKWNWSFKPNLFILEADAFNNVEREWNKIKAIEIKIDNFLDTDQIKFKLLESEDLMAITTIGVFIWTIKYEKGIFLQGFWGYQPNIVRSDNSASERTIKTIKKLLKQFNCSNTKLLPSPSFDTICFLEISKLDFYNTCFKNFIDDYTDNILIKLHGKYFLRSLVRANKIELIEKSFDIWLVKCVKNLEDGQFQKFIRILDIITFSLSDLELSYRSHDFTIRYLKKIAFLLPYRYKDDFLDNRSSASHLQHCKMLKYIRKIPFWKTINSYLSKYSKYYIDSYNTTITIKLIFPTKNFATYDDNYSVLKELIFPPYNSFNSLNSSKFFEFWSLQALVKFKWESFDDIDKNFKDKLNIIEKRFDDIDKSFKDNIES
ncbi:1552_t:CDS:2 [Gigaspora rosea]|nr:1552_t:CDS:2 [Gigaspora rosea]